MIDDETGRGAHEPLVPEQTCHRRWNLSADPSTLFPDPAPADDAPESGRAGRAARIARWLHLTRERLPAAAAVHRWPIRLDHCFMRVCLDHALGGRWDRMVRRPAIRHLSDDQLEAAIACAERLLHRPDTLPALNRASLALRRAHHRAPRAVFPDPR